MAFYEANRRKLTKKTLSSILLNIRMIWSHVKKKYKKTFKNIWWFRKNAILLSFGEVAEWSIAAVLKTVELRGSGGSNPSLSALNSLQGVDFQPCRLFFMPKKLHQKCTDHISTRSYIHKTIFICSRCNVKHYGGCSLRPRRKLITISSSKSIW